MSAQFEHPDFPREIADAPDIENIPAAESMHALMGAVAELHEEFRALGERIVTAINQSATTHQPAPEPEPEWKPGTTGWAVVSDGDDVFSMRVMRVEWDGIFGFATESGRIIADEAAQWSVSDFVPDATATCAHGRTAEDLCNAMPDKVELDAMWTAWKSLTLAEQRGWLEGGEGKVPTPAKVSIRTLMNGGAS